MRKIIAVCTLFSCFWVLSEVNAQVLSRNASSNSQSDTVKSVNKNSNNQLNQQSTANTLRASANASNTNNNANSANVKQQNTNSSSPLKNTVQKNFSYKGNSDNEVVQEEPEDLNNSIGKVISFKIVNDKVILENNDKRNILMYYTDYDVSSGADQLTRCSIKFHVLNDLTEKVSGLAFKVKWPELTTSIDAGHIEPGKTVVKNMTLLGDGCFTLNKVPNIEVNRCRVKGMSQEECADAVRWYDNKNKNKKSR